MGCATQDSKIYSNKIVNYGTTATYAQNNGIQIGGGTSGKCYNNFVANGTGNGIAIFGLGGNDFYNNVIINSGLNFFPDDKTQRVHGIYCDDRNPTPNSSFNFFNNTIVSPKTDGIRFVSKMSANNKFYNNLIVKPGSLGTYPTNSKQNSFINIAAVDGVSADLSNNLYSNNFSNLKLTDTVNNDFRLQIGSPAINSGMDVSGLGVNHDFEGNLRPLLGDFDIGAFEFNDQINQISRKASLSDMSVFLHPAYDFVTLFNIDLSHTLKIEIINLQGKIIKTINQPSKNKIAQGILPSGMYLIKVYSVNSTKFLKLLKK